MKSIYNVQFPKVKMSKEQVTSLIEASRKGDEEARHTLVNANMRLVHAVCKRFLNRDIEYDDLFQIGVIGLLKCIDKFNTDYDVQFSTYAVPMMVGEIQRFLRDDGMVRFSRSVKEIGYKISKEDWHDRDPQEIADILEVTLDQVLSALEFLRNRNVRSTDEVVYENDGDPITLNDQLDGDMNEGWEKQFIFREVIGRLEPRDQTIITMRYYEDKTQAEVAAFFKLSQVQISRLEKKALAQLKKMYEEEKDMARSVALGDRDKAIELLKTTTASFKEINRRTGVPVGSLSKLCKEHRPEELRAKAAAKADRERNIGKARAAREEKRKQALAQEQESSITRPKGVQIMTKLVLPSSSSAKDDKITKVDAASIPEELVKGVKEIKEKRNVQLAPVTETTQQGITSNFTYGVNGAGTKQEVTAQLTLALDMIKLLGDNETINFQLTIGK